MVNWEDFIRARLSEHGGDVSDIEDTVSELAAHLEDLSTHWCALGLSEDEAIQRALAEAPDWKSFFREINRVRNEEVSMNANPKRIWLPGAVALFCSVMGLTGALRNGLFGEGLKLTSAASLFIYVPWLVMQPLVGLFAAYLSKRSGGQRSDTWIISLCSVFIPIVLYAQKLFSHLPESPLGTWAEPALVFRYFLSCLLGWVILPSLAFLAGALVFWSISSRLSLNGRITAE